jgi:hypothetical protein
MLGFVWRARSVSLTLGTISVIFSIWPVMSAEPEIPDLSGNWARNAFNFEPIPGQPAPLVNLKRIADGTGDGGQLVGDFNNSILKPKAAEIVKQKGEISKTGKPYPDPSNSCAPYAPPFTYAMQLGVQIVPAKDHITMLYSQDDQVRRVRLNATHPRNLRPSGMGDSIGHWEGDTLVVDTIGVKPAPYALIDRFGVPVTNALHVVERYRLIDGALAKTAQDTYEKREGRVGGVPGAMAIDPDTNLKGLQIQITVEDPTMFTTAWSATSTYRRGRGPWLEQVCAEADFDFNENKPAEIPKADRPDF